MTPQTRSAQRSAILRRVFTKWLTLDARWYAALGGAWKRRAEARTAREREEADGTSSLLTAFDRIAASWPPPALAELRARQERAK